MDPFGLAAVTIAAAVGYSAFKEWQFTHTGDTVKSLGPAPQQVDRPVTVQNKTLWVSDGHVPITGVNPRKDGFARDRQTLKAGGHPRINSGTFGAKRPFTAPGVDFIGIGRLPYHQYDPRIDVGRDTMILGTEHIPNKEHNPYYQPPLNPGPVIRPKPLAGLLNARAFGTQPTSMSTPLSYMPSNQFWNDRVGATVPTDWTTDRRADQPTGNTPYWRATGTSDQALFFPRRPVRLDQRQAPNFVSYGGGQRKGLGDFPRLGALPGHKVATPTTQS